MRQSRTLQAALGVYTLLVLVFLYVPIIPPLVLSLHAPDRSGTTLESYTQIGQNPVLVSSIQTTLLLGILTAMATFDPVYLEAAYVHGANRLRAFRDVELPLIGRGILGGAIFSFILSLNETVRTQLVEGAHNTVQTYIWSTYLQVGLSPTLYALMTLLILATLLFVLVLLLVNISRLRRAAPAS